jgi:hypothetical protein
MVIPVGLDKQNAFTRHTGWDSARTAVWLDYIQFFWGVKQIGGGKCTNTSA